MRPAEKQTAKPLPIRDVLAAVHPDGTIEVFGLRLAVRIVRVPLARTIEGERLALGCAWMMLPPRWRKLWRRDRLAANGSTRPLTAETMLRSLVVHDSIAALNVVADAGGTQ